MNSLVCLIYADIVCSFQGYTLLNCVKWRWNWSFVQKETMYQWTKKSEIVRKETFHQNLCFAFFYKGFEEHRNILRVVQNLMKEEKVNIKMIHQGPCACAQSIFGRIAEYLKCSIQWSQHMKQGTQLAMESSSSSFFLLEILFWDPPGPLKLFNYRFSRVNYSVKRSSWACGFIFKSVSRKNSTIGSTHLFSWQFLTICTGRQKVPGSTAHLLYWKDSSTNLSDH